VPNFVKQQPRPPRGDSRAADHDGPLVCARPALHPEAVQKGGLPHLAAAEDYRGPILETSQLIATAENILDRTASSFGRSGSGLRGTVAGGLQEGPEPLVRPDRHQAEQIQVVEVGDPAGPCGLPLQWHLASELLVIPVGEDVARQQYEDQPVISEPLFVFKLGGRQQTKQFPERLVRVLENDLLAIAVLVGDRQSQNGQDAGAAVGVLIERGAVPRLSREERPASGRLAPFGSRLGKSSRCSRRPRLDDRISLCPSHSRIAAKYDCHSGTPRVACLRRKELSCVISSTAWSGRYSWR